MAREEVQEDSGNRGEDGSTIDEIVVRQHRYADHKLDRSSLSKLTESLKDTPQSISVISRELLDTRGAASLTDALRNVPGITLGAGEFTWQGDNPTLRGFNARDDMYLDGIRDFGSYPRDPFNVERVEVLLGPSSILFGRGSAGGAVNQASKEPRPEAFSHLSVNLGSDGTVRGTADLSRPVPLLGEEGAFRLNLLHHEGDVAGRDGASAERFGLAPSLAFGVGDRTRLTLSYLKQTSSDRPDYGLPWLDGEPAAVRRSNYYGFSSDYLETDADIGTGRLVHTVGDALDVHALLRYARYERSSRITEPLIIDPVGGGTPLEDVSVFRYVFIGESEERLLAGQLGVTLDLQSGSIGHSLAAGVDISTETSDPVIGFGIGAPATNLVTPTPADPFTVTTADPRIRAETTGKTLAAYLLDTLTLNESWQATLGVRWDRFDVSYDAVRYPGPPTPFNSGEQDGAESFSQVDVAFSWRAALIYKPTDNINAYIAGSTAFNPSAQSLSFLTSGRGLGVGNVSLDPEENRSIEAGIKAALSDDTISMTAAVFETTKTNARIPDPDNPGFNMLGGEHRIRGMSLELSGQPAVGWYVSAGYTYLDSEVVRGPPGAETGNPLTSAPEHSMSIWSDYRITGRFDVGAGITHVSRQLAQNTGELKSVPGYTLVDAMGRFNISESWSVKLNLTNIGDERYFGQLHPWHVVPGPGFTATLAINAFY